MSLKTIGRRYPWADISEAQRNSIVVGLTLEKKQPQQRNFFGKLDGFKDKRERRHHQKMLKSYLRGGQVFKDGFKDVQFENGFVQRMPAVYPVAQMYAFTQPEPKIKKKNHGNN